MRAVEKRRTALHVQKRMMRFRHLLLIAALAPVTIAGQSGQITGGSSVISPDGAIEVRIGVDGRLSYAISYRGKPIVLPSPISMTLASGEVFGMKPTASKTTTRNVDDALRPVVRQKRAEVRDRFTERRIDFAGNYSLVVRAYARWGGVAIRDTVPGRDHRDEGGGNLPLRRRSDDLLSRGSKPDLASGAALQRSCGSAKSRPGSTPMCPRWSCPRVRRRSPSPRPTCSTTRA